MLSRAVKHFQEGKTDLHARKREPASSFQTLARVCLVLCAQYKPSRAHDHSPHARTRSSLTCSCEHFYICQSWGGACWFNCYLKCHWLFPFSGRQYWMPAIR